MREANQDLVPLLTGSNDDDDDDYDGSAIEFYTVSFSFA
jgi:hypothetical protein